MELVLKNVVKNFKDITAVDHVTCSMSNGVYGLLGINGAGKTTLLRMICTLLQPTSGSITCNGVNIFEMEGDYRNLLGYLPQDFGYYPEFSVQDYLLYIASIKGLKPLIAQKRTKELLEKVALSNVKHRKMKNLSGGMKRRAGIAQAMLNDPQILVLDEPTAGLDPNERIRFRNLISELSEERLVLLSTHIVSDIEYIANEIILMKDGKITHMGTTDEIISSMPEKVWKILIDRAEVESYLKRYRIANMKTEKSSVELRVLSENKPHSNAIEIEATLEDAFFYFFGKKAGENDD